MPRFHSANRPFAKRGFTLVELAIVIGIIGLMAGSILIGRDMLRQSELRGLTSDVDRYASAVKLFQDRYMALPGDMKSATTVWTALDPTPATCDPMEATGQATCNGNGNGKIEGYEVGRLWQHLANAQLIDKRYTGTVYDYATAKLLKPGINVPSVAGACGHITYHGPLNTSYNWAAGGGQTTGINHVFIVSGFQAMRCSVPQSALTPAEMLGIDEKMDDGRPALGKIIDYRQEVVSTHVGGDGTTVIPCNTTQVASTAAYNTAFTRRQCSLIFLLAM